MILVRKRVIWFLVVLILCFTIGLGYLGYAFLDKSNFFFSGMEKIRGEWMLFLGIVSAVVLLTVLFIVNLRSRNILRELDRMIDLSRFGGFAPGTSVRKLGDFGEKIKLLYYQLNVQNEKKSLKISAQSNLIGFLVSNIELPLFVSNVMGMIVYVSKELTDKLEISRGEALNNRVNVLFPEFSFQNMALNMEKSKAPITEEISKRTVTFYPVQNRMNQLAYVVGIIGKHELSAQPGANIKEEPEKEGKISNFILTFLSKRRK
jgi:hypothetical protein